jgi:hydroxyacylglutathione hydrolase
MPATLRETFPVGLLSCNCTLLADTVTGEAIVIDPGLDAPPTLAQPGKPALPAGPSHILSRLRALNLRLVQIVITHAHIDHIGGALALKQATGAPILMHQDDLPQLEMMDEQAKWLGVETPKVAPPDASANDGLVVGTASIRGEVLHTPGHTQGSICLYFPASSAPLTEGTGLLFAGDTLFAGTIGRTDFPGGDGDQILRSIEGRLIPLPETTLVIPGHGRETTMAIERARNPFLRGMRG